MNLLGPNSEVAQKLSRHPTRVARNFVLECTLNIERSITDFLAMRLDIDVNNTKALGKTDSAIGFNHKVALLGDIKLISSKDKKKLEALMKIRNKFAHQYDCTSFSACYDSLDGTRNQLEKLYGASIGPTILQEDRDLKLFCKLYDDILNISTIVFNQVLEHYTDKAMTKRKNDLVEIIKAEIESISNREHQEIAMQLWNRAIEKLEDHEKFG